MELPKHNIFLRGLYIIGVIGMFVFMSMVIRGYWSEGTADYKTESSEGFDSQTLAQVTEYYVSEQETKSKPVNMVGLVERPGLNILTKSYVLDLNQPIHKQISKFWLLLFDDEVMLSSDSIVTDKTVYQIYKNYEPMKNTVEVLLGFKVSESMSHSKYEVLILESGSMLPRKSVLDSWQNHEQLPIKLSYELDYEIFQLDDHFQVISQKAFLNPIGE